ncbi:MAG: Type 1 glutamine amidotransferase-like domain-containing protein [Candidatus Ryanbacteria bacterium]|nr:Type 1 glutamine amidotransferase-like domain-containing protein [Candidatus Ryanbacteria bacterium]
MKFLLTSGGLTNQSIADALFDLLGKKAKDTSISFIPTAMNAVSGDKGWFIDDLANIKKQGVKSIDIVDISALPKEVWGPRLEVADVLFFSGGNTSHLMRCIKDSGLEELLPELLKTKVWAGISAGSMVTNPTLALSSKDKKIYYEEAFGYKSEEALGFVDFYVRPHFGSADFPHANKEYLNQVAKEISATIYALDDQSALKVNSDKLEVISEGKFLVFNPKS